MNGGQRDRSVNDPDGCPGGGVVHAQRDTEGETVRIIVEGDVALMAAAVPGNPPPVLVGLHEILLKTRYADGETVFIAVVSLGPSLRLPDLHDEVLVRLGREA